MLSYSQTHTDDCRIFSGIFTPWPGAASRAAAPALAALLAAMWAAPAAADISDTIHPFAAVTVSRDGNLFRLADQDASSGPRADTIRQLQGGFTFERPIGRQVLSGQAKVSKVTFGHYQQLNYNGRDLLAALEWHVGNHIDGHAGVSNAQTLTPFTDFRSNERNLRVQRREYLDGGWRFHPSWRVRGGMTQDHFEYELLSQRFSERKERSAELGVDYLASSDSRVGLQLRRVSSDYPNKRVVGGIGIDEGYVQNELKASIYWRFSGVTQMQFLGGLVERKHSLFTLRDSKGTNGRLVVYWTPLSKLRLTATGWREFGAVESSFVNSSLSVGGSLAATWDISSKLRADAQVRREKRDFSSINGVVFPSGATDTTRSASLGLTYSPHRSIQLGVGLTHDVRDGAALIGTGSYSANGVSLNANARF
ncbi:XrtB/PEP-CTERM-associated polysaccharide biosynthesis outer membrane protein EpsL [Janthinobacterium fluminis]|uniref:Outer membrane beta-barrel protein n=1 Tax=Janthinobacterium fluminis TaxID=2987524 RepID=A0ABT5JXY7_9BURK|nr:XrtB/PEP-CTERM-associated polysaccharide biosynthesis outer membrane protein EpsL [Janthinobacterium fluminis]MDC8757599.1 outer membrane beta-barrel protein [Janthinobacterium fluminis]